jgi:hypothetical protein
MKNSSKFSLFLSIPLAIGLLTIASCGSDSTVSTADAVKAKLTASTWTMKSVTVDGTDKTSVYKNLTLEFTATGFTATNGGVVWPVSGTWSFVTSDAKAIKRDDGLEVTIQEATDTSLKLSLTWSKNTFSPGRVESVSGSHTFAFTK